MIQGIQTCGFDFDAENPETKTFKTFRASSVAERHMNEFDVPNMVYVDKQTP